jgi:formiminoglutamase
LADTRRWHQVVRKADESGSPGVALMGLASDEGIRRNSGRMGAMQGPLALRKMLANLPVLHASALYDAGDVACEGEALDDAQARYAERAKALLDAGHFVVGMGGGHEIVYASYSGLASHLANARQRIGIFNFDAHFDLREQPRASSGTPFLQAIEDARRLGHDVRYHCLGVSRTSNTPDLFAVADRVDARHIQDDALSWTCAELSPPLDIDNATARVAARLIH